MGGIQTITVSSRNVLSIWKARLEVAVRQDKQIKSYIDLIDTTST